MEDSILQKYIISISIMAIKRNDTCFWNYKYRKYFMKERLARN